MAQSPSSMIFFFFFTFPRFDSKGHTKVVQPVEKEKMSYKMLTLKRQMEEKYKKDKSLLKTLSNK